MNNRYYSLDILRGATVALMILVNNPGSWNYIYSPFEHAAWHGCTPTDLVFPFFLFAVGNALSFVMPRLKQNSTSSFLKKIIRRAFLIFIIGLLLNWSPFVKWEANQLTSKSWEAVRILGVLQRIAICYLLASLIIYFTKAGVAAIISGILLLFYWLLCLWLGSSSLPFSLQGYFGTPLDIKILGINHIYKGENIPFDPEGLFSSIPAIVQVTSGYLVGRYIQHKGKTYEMLTSLFIAATGLTLIGYCWDMVFPINKKIWTSSYVLYSTGSAVFTLAILIFLIEFKNKKGFVTRFFDVFGRNPLFIFVLSGFLPRLLGLIRIPDGIAADGKTMFISPLSWFYTRFCKPLSDDQRLGSLSYAVAMVLFYWLIAYIMDKKKIYIKV